jgi:zinc D-Ala-D-Ala carboxypeptidase
MNNLTDHFTLAEMTFSQEAVRNGITNVPNQGQIKSLTLLCENILEPLRIDVDKPINVTSGFRNPIINTLIGGSLTSQHMKGEAADINVEGFTPQQLFDLIRNSALPYDQLIQEFDRWVHVSFGPRNRRQSLFARKNSNNRTVFSVA